DDTQRVLQPYTDHIRYRRQENAGSAAARNTGLTLARGAYIVFLDADDFHPPANIARMRRGEPLDDADRQPWLEALNWRLIREQDQGRPVVLACSALKRRYREHLAAGLEAVRFVYLRLDRDRLARRLRERSGHFFAGELLDSQLAALEAPDDALVVDADAAPEAIVERILRDPAVVGAPPDGV
ncbi:MAG: gluconokinase, GntK/IdnK-type, partial [Candidatus Competibacterales bacterium]|nr:gluconokinase, GntK/IdnK-type [Candidatus Competibacterales bacterium]